MPAINKMNKYPYPEGGHLVHEVDLADVSLLLGRYFDVAKAREKFSDGLGH